MITIIPSADVSDSMRNDILHNQHEIPLINNNHDKNLPNGKRFLNVALLAVKPDLRKKLLEGGDTVDGIPEQWGEDKNIVLYKQAYNCMLPPLFIPLITTIQVGVFLYYCVKLLNENNRERARSGWDLQSPLAYNPYKRNEAWRFLSYALIHHGYMHLMINSTIQLLLGILLETVHKFWRVGIVYTSGVLAGSLAHSVFDPFVYLVGASGGCYALVGGHIATIIINWKEMQQNQFENKHNEIMVWLINQVIRGAFQLGVLILFVCFDMGYAFYDRYANPPLQRIGFAAHTGGLCAGLLVGIPFLRNFDVSKCEKVLFVICIIASIVLLLVAVIFNVFCATLNVSLCYSTT